ncbi:rieske iron-sulfur protein of cytochrome B6/F complex [Dunaliella salina]|uniref:plastoquinol--plastocyanin reductase n=1 Tax=Dunaliella salina TaxID=3046 RepID=A0ABQ7GRI7_DUNSA|nr:rieske iron-sulfur protein of cytochrome B6/F complex [Dunaliella salina]|eukprot:KAF5837220.1 rieske iron-sulfur protein of cytochrome B6/F complex [Dunaliella salina]
MAFLLAKQGLNPAFFKSAPKRVSRRTVQPVRAAGAASAEEVPDMNKRNIMNLVLAGGVGLPAVSLAGPFAYFFVPPGGGGDGGGQSAKDILGADVTIKQWLQGHPQPGSRELAQGLKGDPTYLVTNQEGSGIEPYGINAVCTHLGCVVPWAAAENKFKCPCHGSQYNAEGKVVRGPAPLSLALAHADVSDTGVILFSPWTETDFRTGTEPWWS